MKNINLDMNNFEPVNTKIENINIDNEQVLKVVKAKKIMEFDENTYAKLIDSSFHNGVIEVKMLSRLLKDAPDFARGFIGIAYRINEDDSAFESFYLRPTNGRIDDPVRKIAGVSIFHILNIHLLILEIKILLIMKDQLILDWMNGSV
ncbi:hypothetical protein SD457_21750 [Coprobacillaceae bacterium CR2/5/TPMF4]|nr:hypothetical protein SD457_21750 [Coprobacillaceae bacterium CR2/5/TPMF4]